MRLVRLGTIGQPHGLKGAFVLMTDTGKESSLPSLHSVYIGKDPQAAQEYPLREASWMPRGWKVSVQGVNTIDGAQALQGLSLFAARQALPELKNGEFYLDDLHGACAIESSSGKIIGRFVELEPALESGASDRWWFELEGRKVGVPATQRYIQQVRADRREIWLRNLVELL